MYMLLQLSENSRLKLQKQQANQKTHGWPQGHRTIQLPKYMGRTEETIQEKPIQKLGTYEGTEGMVDQETSC